MVAASIEENIKVHNFTPFTGAKNACGSASNTRIFQQDTNVSIEIIFVKFYFSCFQELLILSGNCILL